MRVNMARWLAGKGNIGKVKDGIQRMRREWYGCIAFTGTDWAGDIGVGCICLSPCRGRKDNRVIWIGKS